MVRNMEIKTSANIVLAIVGLTVANSTFVILLGICANVGLTFFKCPTIANTYRWAKFAIHKSYTRGSFCFAKLPPLNFAQRSSFHL